MPIPVEDMDVFCLICDMRLKFPEGIEGVEGDKYNILGWVNNHLVCPKCSIDEEYFRTPLKIGVHYVKELEKNRDAAKRKN